MSNNLSSPNNIEKNLKENPFIILFESKVIIKNNQKRIDLFLNQISDVRIIRYRDLTFSIALLVWMPLLYLLIFSSIDLNFALSSLCSILFIILFAISFLKKKYTYKLLINQGKYGFNEISISKKNIIYAENFAKKFKNGKTEEMTTEEFEHPKMEECLY